MSTGTMLSLGTGLEPYYGFTYYRSGRLGQFIEVKTPISQRYFDQHPEATSLPDYYVSATELSPLEHVRVQGVIQRWTDSAISKTCNAPRDFTVEDNKELYMEAWKAGCKGVTVYVDGSRDTQVLNLTAEENSIEDETSRKKGIDQTSYNADDLDILSTEEIEVTPTNACSITWDEQGNMIKECS